MRTLLVLASLLAVCIARAAVPGVLIVQEVIAQDKLGDPNIAIANILAENIEKEGFFAPVVWSYTDPIFRAAVNDGLVKGGDKIPTLAQAQEAAKKMKLEYIIYVRAYQYGNNVMGRLQLYKAGKMIWKDPEKPTEILPADQQLDPVNGVNSKGQATKTFPKPQVIKLDDRAMSVMGPDGLKVEDSARSLVTTWLEFLRTGPLKNQTAQPKILTPEALPGTKTDVPLEAIVPKIKPKVDNKQLLSDLDAMIRGGQSVAAILVLRDAVDAEPQDLERRTALVRTLLLVGQPELAAKEARRAAELLPDKAELRAMAARAWMQAGREDEAMADLNEAVARDPNSRETRLLLAEVNLSKLRGPQALEHLDAVIKDKADAEIWYKHAIGQALVGNKEGVTADLPKVKDLGLPNGSQEVAVRYDMTLDVLDKSLMSLGEELRELFSRAQVRRTDAEVKAGFQKAKSLVDSWATLVSANIAPNLHRSSHDRRLLALNLLSQSLNDLGTYLTTNDADLFADARINMGQALKEFSSAQASYRNEIGGTAKGVGT